MAGAREGEGKGVPLLILGLMKRRLVCEKERDIMSGHSVIDRSMDTFPLSGPDTAF